MIKRKEIPTVSSRYWDRAWSLVDGCTHVSEGCDHCWLEQMNKRFGDGKWGKAAFKWDRIDIPKRRRVPTTYAIWSDLFHEDVTDDEICQAIDVMECEAPQHTYLIITKRPERAYDIIHGYHNIPNVWLGVTAENQEQADKRIPILLQLPAAVRFVSVEPMLGAIDLSDYVWEHDNRDGLSERDALDWVICGGETGPGARPMDPTWGCMLDRQCRDAGVPFFFKRWGNHTYDIEMPREYPESYFTHNNLHAADSTSG